MQYSSGIFFKNRVLSISFILTILFSSTVYLLIYKTQQNSFMNTRKDFESSLQLSIDHTIQESIRSYKLLADTVLESTQAKALMAQGKREALYEHIKSYWKLWSKRNPDLKIMLFHKYDGTAFLRMHKPEVYDDYLSGIRPMVKAAHEQKKVLTGYETGKYSTVFRVLTPIFYKNRYIGTLDFGINPNYFIKEIYQKTGHKGVLFVQKEHLKLFKRDSQFQHSDYILQSRVDTKLLNMLQHIPKSYHLAKNMQWSYGGRNYILHAKDMKDFRGNEQAKLLFFYDVTTFIKDQRSFISILLYTMIIFLVSMFFLLNSSFKKLLLHLKNMHENHTRMMQEKEKLMIAQSRQAAMGEMISMIAHQWRQPLTVIGMHTSNILIEHALDKMDMDKMKEHINGINLQVEHLSSTINDFRDFFKPDKQKTSVSCEKIIADLSKMIDQNMRDQEITVTYTVKTELALYTYAHELLQVLLILVSNAKDAIAEQGIKEGKIEVICSDDGNYVYIEVCDNGKGIKKEDMKSLFEPYFSTKGKNGTGLGLYMSKIIMNKHINGDITFENREEGICFKLMLPLDKE